jgi:FdhE protein
MQTAAELARMRPEWAPWLALVEIIQAELPTQHWRAAETDGASAVEGIPMLAAAALTLAPQPVARLLEELRRTAAASAMTGNDAWSAARFSEREAVAVFRAGLFADRERLYAQAQAARIDAGAFASIGALLPVPFLHACRLRWSAAFAPGWRAGYCPCCGAWPAFAEICGIERTRYLRCGRCAMSWEAHCLHCSYCGETDHEALGTLVSEQEERRRAIEVCSRCKGYLKAFHTLAPSPAAELMLVDLESVELDVAAASRGYVRPAGLGYRFAAADVSA